MNWPDLTRFNVHEHIPGQGISAYILFHNSQTGSSKQQEEAPVGPSPLQTSSHLIEKKSTIASAEQSASDGKATEGDTQTGLALPILGTRNSRSTVHHLFVKICTSNLLLTRVKSER